MVVASEPISSLAVPYVAMDRGGGAETAVRHLRSVGHHRIAALIGFTGRAGHDFRHGYCRGLVGTCGAVDPALMLELQPGVP